MIKSDLRSSKISGNLTERISRKELGT